jgi:hypothetical protein
LLYKGIGVTGRFDIFKSHAVPSDVGYIAWIPMEVANDDHRPILYHNALQQANVRFTRKTPEL